MDKKLKRLLIYYAVSAFFSTVSLAGAILSDRYITSLSNTLNQFQTLKINHFKMKGSLREMEATSSRVHSIIPSDYKPEEMEGAILTAVDSLKSRIKGVNIVIGNFDRKENEVSLPITMTGNMGDYIAFVNELGYLQSLISPFLFIDSVSIAKSSDETREAIIFNIKGILKIQSRTTGVRT
jgi:hypothetical protein